MVSAKLLVIAALSAGLTHAQEASSLTVAVPSSTFTVMDTTSSASARRSGGNSAINSLLSRVSAATDVPTATPTGAANGNDAKYAAMLGGGAIAIGMNLFA